LHDIGNDALATSNPEIYWLLHLMVAISM